MVVVNTVDTDDDDPDDDDVIKLLRRRTREFTAIATSLPFCVLGLLVGIVVRLVEIVACFMIVAEWAHSSHGAYRVILLVLSKLSIAVYLPILIATVRMIRNKQKVQQHWPTKKCHVCCDDDAVVVDGSHLSSTCKEEPRNFYCILSLLSGMSIGSYLTWATIYDILGGQPTSDSGSFLASCVLDLILFSVLVWLYQLDRPESTNRDRVCAEEEQEEATVLIV
jgi:hypothetical protein